MDCRFCADERFRVPHRCTQPQHSKIRIHPKRSAPCRFRQFPTTTRAAWTRSVSIETYSPEKSEAEITAMLSSAEEIRPNTDFQNGKAYKISKDNIYRNKISKDGMGSDNPAIIIIEAQLGTQWKQHDR